MKKLDREQRNVQARLRALGNALAAKKKKRAAVRGLYIWGGVGRGKTMLMDEFFQSLPEGIAKRRVHYHEFMIGVHDEMHKARQKAIGRTRRRAPLQQGTQRPGIAHPFVKAQIVEEQDEGPVRAAQQREKRGQARQFVDRALQQGDVPPLPLQLADDGRHHRRLARPARTP